MSVTSANWLARRRPSNWATPEGNVPLEALECHLWLYQSDYYRSLIEKAKLTDPAELTYSGETIEIPYACSNRNLLRPVSSSSSIGLRTWKPAPTGNWSWRSLPSLEWA